MKPIIDCEDVVDACWDITKRPGQTPLIPWKTLLNVIICGTLLGQTESTTCFATLFMQESYGRI
jgi:hypothetical protein